MQAGPLRSMMSLLIAVGLGVALTLSATACGRGSTLTIGVKFDQPGFGMKNADGSLSGFDVDVARYVAGQLGYTAGKVKWMEAPAGQRETLIQNGQVDFVVANYSITDARKEKISFAGPYLVAGQSLLVRADNAEISGAGSLQDNKKLCSVAGSTPAQRIKDAYPSVQLQSYKTDSACIDALKVGAIDAATADDVILVGYAAQSPGTFRLVGEPFSAEEYGIGLKKDDTATRNKINDAIVTMEQDGLWKAAFETNLGASGYAVPVPPQVDRY